MKTIRYCSNAAPKEALAIATWDGEHDNLPPPAEFKAEGGIIDFARVQDNESGGVAVLLCGEIGSGAHLELARLLYARGDMVEVYRVNVGVAADVGGLIASLIKMKVRGIVRVVRKREVAAESAAAVEVEEDEGEKAGE